MVVHRFLVLRAPCLVGILLSIVCSCTILFPVPLVSASTSSSSAPPSIPQKGGWGNKKKQKQTNTTVTELVDSNDSTENSTTIVNFDSYWPLWYPRSSRTSDNEEEEESTPSGGSTKEKKVKEKRRKSRKNDVKKKNLSEQEEEKEEEGQKRKEKDNEEKNKEKKDTADPANNDTTTQLEADHDANDTQTNSNTTISVDETRSSTLSPATNSSSSTMNNVNQTTPSYIFVRPPGTSSTANGPSPYFYRGRIISPGSPSHLHPQQQPPFPPSRRSNNSNVEFAVTELVATLLGTFVRLWLLRWISIKITQEEEFITPIQHFVWERLNDKYIRDTKALQTALNLRPNNISERKWKKIVQNRKKRDKQIASASSSSTSSTSSSVMPNKKDDIDQIFSRTVVVVDLLNDTTGKLDLEYLSNVVTFLISQHRIQAFGPTVEIIFKVYSPGGPVGTFGLASSQIKRLTDSDGITTTVCVDVCAASGGYMIASQANKIIASPFATIGSIGVMLEGLNFHDILKQYNIKPISLKSGDSKNPISTFGQVSKSDIDIEQKHLNSVHESFKDLVLQGRPKLLLNSQQGRQQLLAENNEESLALLANTNDEDTIVDIDKVCDGSVYLGHEAKKLYLVDDVMTSDEYILNCIHNGDRVILLHKSHQFKYGLYKRLFSPMDVVPQFASMKKKVLNALHNMSNNNNNDNTPSLKFPNQLVQLGTYYCFIQHLLNNYFVKRK